MQVKAQIVAAVVIGQVVGMLGYVEAIFFPLVLAGPLVVGAVAAARGVRLLPVLALWVSAGLNMLVLDWVLAQEDVLFHAGLTVVMALLAAAGYGVVSGTRRRTSARA